LPARSAGAATPGSTLQPLWQTELRVAFFDLSTTGGITSSGCPHGRAGFSTFAFDRDRFVMHTVQVVIFHEVD
jgi:hypothetical protein